VPVIPAVTLPHLPDLIRRLTREPRGKYRGEPMQGIMRTDVWRASCPGVARDFADWSRGRKCERSQVEPIISTPD
jgi:hypothetical protein